MLSTSKIAKVVGASGLLALATIPTFAQSTVLKFSTMEDPNGPTFKCFTEHVLNEMVEATDNTLEIEEYMGGTAFTNPRKKVVGLSD